MRGMPLSDEARAEWERLEVERRRLRDALELLRSRPPGSVDWAEHDALQSSLARQARAVSAWRARYLRERVGDGQDDAERTG